MRTSSDRFLHIDIETYSSIPIKNGPYKYASAEDFTILLFAYAFDNDPVRVIDLAQQEAIPDEVLAALSDPAITKIAHNANFERTCLSVYFNKPMPPEQWKCSMVYAYYCGLPGSLKKVGKVLGIESQKLETGTRLINYYCQPDKFGERRPAWIDPASWDQFKEYCKRDVEAEQEVWNRLEQIAQVPQREWRLWQLDQKINDLGIGINTELVEAVQTTWMEYQKALLDQVKEFNPDLNIKSNKQFLEYLKSQYNLELPNLQAATLDQVLEDYPFGEIEELVLLRKELTRTALKKYDVFSETSVDGRIRGILQFYGAHTGRWSGRLIQPQNLPRPRYEDYDEIRSFVLNRDLDGLRDKYRMVADALSSIIRTVIECPDGLTVADYSAIECRVVAWLADEQWVLDAFADRKDIYCETASQMFGVPVTKHGENGHLRSKGKIATLACGYGGSVGALKAFGADRMGMSEDDMKETVTKWREANRNICKYWQAVEITAKEAILHPGKLLTDEEIAELETKSERKAAIRKREKQTLPHGVSFYSLNDGGFYNLYCSLPTGRTLVYYHADLADRWESSDGKPITRGGQSYIRKPRQTYNGDPGWYFNTEIVFMDGEILKSTWGGKLVENITQAVARDCLASALLRLDAAGYKTVAHIHDEVIVEGQDLEGVCRIMGQSLPWAPGLDLRAEGFVSPYYKKD